MYSVALQSLLLNVFLMSVFSRLTAAIEVIAAIALIAAGPVLWASCACVCRMPRAVLGLVSIVR